MPDVSITSATGTVRVECVGGRVALHLHAPDHGEIAIKFRPDQAEALAMQILMAAQSLAMGIDTTEDVTHARD